MKLSFVFLFVFFCTNIFAQKYSVTERRGNYFTSFHVEELNNESISIHSNNAITALTLLTNNTDDFQHLFIISQKDTFAVTINHEVNELPQPHEKVISQLIEFKEAVSDFKILANQFSDVMDIHCYHAGNPLPDYRHSADSSVFIDCSKPSMIYPSEWRNGLPAPKVSPTYTVTEHIVIHHTAGSNTQTDHLLSIRNIYLAHTQTNGWDDIGYNYLIARDGTLYQARDAQNLMADDFVKGAHFCGKNTNTMGVSLMGDYSIDLPTPQALLTLNKLLLWKLFKDKLNPYDSFEHPKSAVDAIMLPAVCGHRDGCATECPGLSFYLMLPKIKAEIDSLLKLCESNSYQLLVITDEIKVYPNPFSNNFNIICNEKTPFLLEVYDFTGKKILLQNCETPNHEVNLSSYPDGIYHLIISKNGMYATTMLLKQ